MHRELYLDELDLNKICVYLSSPEPYVMQVIIMNIDFFIYLLDWVIFLPGVNQLIHYDSIIHTYAHTHTEACMHT